MTVNFKVQTESHRSVKQAEQKGITRIAQFRERGVVFKIKLARRFAGIFNRSRYAGSETIAKLCRQFRNIDCVASTHSWFVINYSPRKDQGLIFNGASVFNLCLRESH
jgi:hypothetical protein